MAIAKQVSDGSPDGASFGQSATDKISFYGATPISQRTSANQATVTTTAATTTTPWGYSTSTQANAVVTLLNELQASMVAIGMIKGS